MSNPFGNPFEAEPPAEPIYQPYASQYGGTQIPAYSTGYEAQPYLAGTRPPKPIAPQSVSWVIITLWALAALLGGVLILQTLLNPSTLQMTFIVVAVINIGLGIALKSRPGKAVQVLTTAYSALWCLSIAGAVIAIPLIILLWSGEAKDYFSEGDRRAAARAAAQH